MTNWKVGFFTGLLLGTVLLPSGLASDAKVPPPKQIIPAGSLLHVRLQSTLTSKTNKTGDTFTGLVTQPIVANGQELVPVDSTVEGHVAFVQDSGRVKGVAQMRLVLDDVITPDDVKLTLPAGLDDMNSAACAKSTGDNEGTIKGCGKNKKDAMKDAAIGGAMGASAGAGVAMGAEMDCMWFGDCGGPGFGTSLGVGAGIGAGSVLVYDLLKHEKHIILAQGTTMTFVINHSVDAGTGKPLDTTNPTNPAK
jgi:hypothetical protein